MRFTEKMSGTVEGKEEVGDKHCEFVVTIVAADVEEFLKDAKHEASVVGTVTCPLMSKHAITIEKGIILC